MKISAILNSPNVKILLYLYDSCRCEGARFSELLKNVVVVRSTLAYTLAELEDEGLVYRKVISSKPIQVRYLLTDKGMAVAECFARIRSAMM